MLITNLIQFDKAEAGVLRVILEFKVNGKNLKVRLNGSTALIDRPHALF
jgi:hypothetical protein